MRKEDLARCTEKNVSDLVTETLLSFFSVLFVYCVLQTRNYVFVKHSIFTVQLQYANVYTVQRLFKTIVYIFI